MISAYKNKKERKMSIDPGLATMMFVFGGVPFIVTSVVYFSFKNPKIAAVSAAWIVVVWVIMFAISKSY